MAYSLQTRKVLAMIMAGGQGSRLQPLTSDRAKPAVHFAGKYRIIDFVLNNFINSGIYKIKVLTQFKSDSLNRHITSGWTLNRSLGQYVDLVPAQMRTGGNWYRGTADAIYQNINLITDENPDFVAVFGGDHIYKMDVNQMIDYHQQKAALATVSAIPVPREEAMDFGVIQVDNDGRMIGFEEKPEDPKEIPGRPGWCLASMGNYIFNSRFLVRELMNCVDRDNGFDFGQDILPAIFNDYPVYVYDFNTNIVPGESALSRGYWKDVGTIEAFYEANLNICAVTPEFNLYNKQWPLRTLQENAPPAKFVFAGGNDTDPLGQALDSVVSGGCIISGATVRTSVLSQNVVINTNATVENAVIFPEATIGQNCKIRNVIIEKGVDIPDDYEIGYDLEKDTERFCVTSDGIIVVPKNAQFPV
ncbi:MAG: glucose-1-phosphate adenylyltransferase [Fibrobacterales bacterium]